MAGYIGQRSVTLSTTVANAQDVTATDTTPEVTIINNTHEDSDLGREGKVIFKGQQSGGEESTLAEIEAHHHGSSDDEKGSLVIRTNDGSDGSSPTERLRIDSDGSISTATLGTSNVKLGLNAGKVIASGGNYNTLIGEDAGIAISTGDRNTAVGYQSLKTTSTGQYNTAIGYQALEANTGSGNTAVGDQALEANIGGANNTAVGDDAGVAVTTGSNNTFIGVATGDGTDDGGNNTAVGKSALTSNCGDNNTAVGLEALRDTTGSVNTAIGKNSGNAITSGGSNTIVGSYTGNQDSLDIRTDSNNIVISDGAGYPRIHSNSGGYTKFTADNATQYAAGGNYHEFNHNNNDTSGIIISNQHGSYSSAVLYLRCQRVASSAYHLATFLSGGGSDNEFVLRGDGNGYCDGSWSGGGADYAEYFEWADGNSDSQDRTGYTVVLDGEKIKLATSDDAASNVIGAVSANPSVVGDSDIGRWKQKYLKDDFGAYIFEDYNVEDDDGNTVVQQRRKPNPDYNSDTAYISREDRKEWSTIGMMGKLRIRKGQPTGDRWIKMRDVSDTVEEWLVR